MVKGLDVKGLDVTELSRKMEKYIADYFPDYTPNTDKPLFLEGHLFWLEEIISFLPDYHYQYFTDNSRFIGMSGYLAIDYIWDKASDSFVMLLMDEHSEYAYLLFLREMNKLGVGRTIIIKDFLTQEHSKGVGSGVSP